LRKPTCTGRMIKKCSLAVIGKVSAPASRIQEIEKQNQIAVVFGPFVAAGYHEPLTVSRLVP